MIADELSVDVKNDVAEPQIGFGRRRLGDDLRDDDAFAVVATAFDAEPEPRVDEEARSRQRHFAILVGPRIDGFGAL